MKGRQSQTKIYRPQSHVADNDVGVCAGIYRGFRLACLGSEIERLKRSIDDHWTNLYQAAASPSEKVAVLMAERQQRTEPKDWSGS